VCFRLLEGADIYQVAKNCRTSVEMIEKHYAAHLKNTLDASAINVRKSRGTESAPIFALRKAEAEAIDKNNARVAELVDARDSKSRSQKEWGFDSLHGHHTLIPHRLHRSDDRFQPVFRAGAREALAGRIHNIGPH
jgi:hypothetical protein